MHIGDRDSDRVSVSPGGRQRIAVELLRSTLWGVQDKRSSQFLTENTELLFEFFSSSVVPLFLLTRPARKHLGQLLGYEVRLEAALQLSSVIKKRGLIFRVGGRVSSLQKVVTDDLVIG